MTAQVFDAIVIGGGVMGCSTAFELSQRGLKVALLEKNTLGQGPSGRSSAIIRQHYSNELTARMAFYSLGVFQNFAQQVGGDSGFTKTGFVVVVSKEDLAGLEENIALQRAVGIQTELLSTEALHDVMPSLATDDLLGGAYEPHSGYAEPYLTLTSYANAAKARGAQVFQGTPVTGVRFASGKVIGVETPQGHFDAPLVINATGVWSPQIMQMLEVDIPVNPSRVQVAVFKRPMGQEAIHPVVADFIHASYFRPETGNLTLAGLIDPSEGKASVDPDHYNEIIDRQFVLESGERMIARYPAMEQSHSTGGYVSMYDITPDWHPIIDELPAGSGFYNCSGFSGHGFKLAPAVSRMTADLVTDISDPLFDAYPFRLSRFAEGDLVRGKYAYSITG